MQETNDIIEKQARKEHRRSTLAAAFYIWRFRIITSLILAIVSILLKKLIDSVINLEGVAITTANIAQIIDWRSLIIVVLGLLIVFLYIVFEIFSQIYLSDDLITGNKPGTFRELGRGFRAIKRFVNPKGILIFVFILFGVPLTGIGFSVGLTNSLYIPRFISSVMFSSPVVAILYWVMLVFFIWIAFQWIFCFHAVLIDNMAPAKALKYSRDLSIGHWKDLLLRIARILILSAIIFGIMFVLVQYLPDMALNRWGDKIPGIGNETINILEDDLSAEQEQVFLYRTVCGTVMLLGGYVMYLVSVLIVGNLMVQLTRIYYMYTGRDHHIKKIKVSKGRFVVYVLLFVGVPVLLGVCGTMIGGAFDYIFSRESKVAITAHRTGGYLASENSLEGIDVSVEHGLYGGETDIQRTKDGQYIILHDKTFKRLTGVNKKPGDMTLEEIKELRIKDTTGSGELLPVPTLEELLDRGKGRLHLFLELKGVSADKQMADDIVKAVKERGMEDEVTLISLNYKAIDYAEKTYPEIETGLLIFAGLGDVSAMNCDMIIMEEEMSTNRRISEIHDAAKKVGVWTVDTEDSMYHFLNSSADTVITDDILLAESVEEELAERNDLEILQDGLGNIF